MKCTNCGIELKNGVKFCENCGVPVKIENDKEILADNLIDTKKNVKQDNKSPIAFPNQEKPNVQKNAVNSYNNNPYSVNSIQSNDFYDNSNNSTTKKSSKKTLVIITCAVIFSLLCGIGGPVGVHTYKVNKYHKTLQSAVDAMYLGAVDCEEACTLIHDVWYNTIFEKNDITTDKYTQSTGGHYESWSGYSYFNEDFNDSLQALFADEEFHSTIQSIKNWDILVAKRMGALKNPPRKYEAEYNEVKELYDSYTVLYECAVNSSGNLTSYTQKYNDADNKFAAQYKICKDY